VISPADDHGERGGGDPFVDVALEGHGLNGDGRGSRGTQRLQIEGSGDLVEGSDGKERVVVGGDEVLESARGGLGRVEVRGDVEALRPADEDGSVRNGRHEVWAAERR
jgi:hypothetical protein